MTSSSSSAYISNLNFGFGQISAYCFNKDKTGVAICRNSNIVELYKLEPNASPKLVATLDKHEKVVTGIDWAPKSNKIVTCSQDRNAFVYSPVSGSGGQVATQWESSQVFLRINRGANCIKWSPDETKFAVASSARIISICFYEADNDWWICKHIRRPLRSTVLCVSWHPNSIILAAGCADSTMYVFSAFLREINQKPTDTTWGVKLPFNSLCATIKSYGWVHGVQFSPSGSQVAFVSHDATVQIVRPVELSDTEDAQDLVKYQVETVTLTCLPMTSLSWITENSIVVAGHQFQPLLLSCDHNNRWKIQRSLDPEAVSTRAALTSNSKNENENEEDASVSFSELKSTFRRMDLHGIASSRSSAPQTVHKNTIIGMQLVDDATLSTGSLDGTIALWDVSAVA